MIAVVCCALSALSALEWVRYLSVNGFYEDAWYARVGEVAWSFSWPSLLLLFGLYVLSRRRPLTERPTSADVVSEGGAVHPRGTVAGSRAAPLTLSEFC